MNRHVHYINTSAYGLESSHRQNVRLLDAIEAQQQRDEATIEFAASIIVLGIVATVILLVWW